MDQPLSIKIKIADREYPLQTDPSMESKLRAAGKALNDKIKKLSKDLGVHDRQDLIAMAALDSLVELYSLREVSQKNQALLLNKIDTVHDLAESVL